MQFNQVLHVDNTCEMKFPTSLLVIIVALVACQGAQVADRLNGNLKDI